MFEVEKAKRGKKGEILKQACERDFRYERTYAGCDQNLPGVVGKPIYRLLKLSLGKKVCGKKLR